MQPPSPPKSKLRSWLSAEWDHLITLPIPTLLLLATLTLTLILFDPLLPFVGYGLWIWAAQSWQWRSRWASINTLARQGGWFVASLCILALLAEAHIWFFPALVSVAQALWHMIYLPGDLGLLPFQNDLFARCILFLPLAPTVAILYEAIEPRTEVDPRRRLLPTDLAQPTVAPPPSTQPSPPSEPQEEKKDQATTASTTTQEPQQHEKKKRPPRSTRTSKQQTHEPEAEQLTIDSYLATPPDQVKQQEPTTRSRGSTTSSSRTTGTRKKKQDTTVTSTPAPEEPSTQQQPKTINWDDVAE
jgi:hypothetical protein